MPSNILVSRSLVQQDKSTARLTTTIFVKTTFLACSVIERTCSSSYVSDYYIQPWGRACRYIIFVRVSKMPDRWRVKMKLGLVAIILFASTPASFAGNFTPIPKNKIAQTQCSTKCQVLFDTCDRLRTPPPPPPPTAGTQQVSPVVPPVIIGQNCEFERDTCLRACVANPKG